MNTHTQVRRRWVRRLSLTIGIGVGALLAVILPALEAAADPLDRILLQSVPRAAEGVLDDESLSGIRGRGADQATVRAGEAERQAIRLWDEDGRPGRQGGTVFAHTVGNDNVQSTSLFAKRY